MQLTQVGHTFEGSTRPVLADIDLQIESGDFVSLLGASGIGKSTLLRVMGGLLQPSDGMVQVHGRDLATSTVPIGIVFQKDNLMPWRTATENVRLPLEIRGERGAEVDQRVHDMLGLVGLAGFEQAYPAQLSGGMAQRVAIARALIHQPELLLLDEPFGALDALTRERMGQELLRIWEALPVTVVMVTHSISEAVLLADRVLVMGADGPNQPAHIEDDVEVALPRPRSPAVQHSEVFQACERRIRAGIGANGHA